jgi:hypothetical protein
MNLFELEFWQRNQRTLGAIALFVGLGAWAVELSGMVYICPYCRVQRSVIAILGVVMLFPDARHWLLRYICFTIGFLGAVVAANQNFMGWAKISKGEFVLGEQWYFNPFLMSGAALFIIIAQVALILLAKPGPAESPGEIR